MDERALPLARVMLPDAFEPTANGLPGTSLKPYLRGCSCAIGPVPGAVEIEQREQ